MKICDYMINYKFNYNKYKRNFNMKNYPYTS